MTKSYVEELLNAYSAVFQDLKYAFPQLVEDLSKDWIRLSSHVERRGLPFLMVDLPALAKHLERCLAAGEYKLSGLPGSRRVSKRVVIPKFLRGLYLLIFHIDGRLKEDANAEAIFFVRQVYLLAKRIAYQCTPDVVQQEIADFVRIDSLLPEPSSWWSEVRGEVEPCLAEFAGFAGTARYASKMPRVSKSAVSSVMSEDSRCDDYHLLVMLDKVVGLVSSALGPYRPEDWNFRHGPGSVSDLMAGENRFLFKNWSERLESVFPVADYAFHSWSSWGSRHLDGPGMGSIEPCSKLVDVPKTFAKPRLIASEPSEHMWCQQNVKHFMYTRVGKTWLSLFLDFQDQRLNQRLCVEGSRDGSLSTVDLSSASDRVSCLCVGNAFRQCSTLLNALRATRTRFCSIPSARDGRTVLELRKYSTMGNATTFPVESLIFLAIALTATLALDGNRKVSLARLKALQGKVSVFGDDIIVPTESVGTLTKILEVLDFKVNASKTFSTGLFRESCGVDSYAGQTITPAYLKCLCEGSPESVVSTVDVANNFYKRLMVNTSNWLASTLPEWLNVPLVAMDSRVLGLHVFGPIDEVPLTQRVRWNRDLQRHEVLLVAVEAKSEVNVFRDDTRILQFFTEDPDPGIPWQSGARTRPATKLRRRWVALSDLRKVKKA